MSDSTSVWERLRAVVGGKPAMTRDYALARIARALGVAGYPVEECDALMAWVQEARPPAAGGRACEACQGTGHTATVSPYWAIQTTSDEQEREFLIQGICTACRGRGVQ